MDARAQQDREGRALLERLWAAAGLRCRLDLLRHGYFWVIPDEGSED